MGVANVSSPPLTFETTPNAEAEFFFFVVVVVIIKAVVDVDKAVRKTQKKGRGEVAINVHTSVHSGPVCGRQRGEDRMNFS